MSALRIITGLLLALVVAPLNGVSGIGYTAGGEFEARMQVAAIDETSPDPHWKRDPEGRYRPRDLMSTLSLLMDTGYGRFGLSLQVFCLLQFIAGVFVMFRKSAGALSAGLLSMVGVSGVGAEVLGAHFSSTWGVTNVVGAVVSFALIFVSLLMYRSSRQRQSAVRAV